MNKVKIFSRNTCQNVLLIKLRETVFSEADLKSLSNENSWKDIFSSFLESELQNGTQQYAIILVSNPTYVNIHWYKFNLYINNQIIFKIKSHDIINTAK